MLLLNELFPMRCQNLCQHFRNPHDPALSRLRGRPQLPLAHGTPDPKNPGL